MLKYVLLIIISIGVFACAGTEKKQNQSACQYKLDQLLLSDSPQVLITYINDTLIEVRDNGKDSSSGIYTFDKNENLRFYAYLIDKDHYKYSEIYDTSGNLTKTEGVPLVEYRLWKKDKDNVKFTFFLFSLNKDYAGIEIITNRNDTLRPKFLYKSTAHTNIKCFSVELPVAKAIRDLTMYTKGSFVNRCTQEKNYFRDTISFRNINL